MNSVFESGIARSQTPASFEEQGGVGDRRYAALLEYAAHRPWCVLAYTRSVLANASWCNCGLTEVLASLSATPEGA